jgi:hypothetical protein
MHGTFPTEVNGAAIIRRSHDGRAYVVIRAREGNRSAKLKTALLVAGCCFAALPQSSLPGPGDRGHASPGAHTALPPAPAATSLAPPSARGAIPAGRSEPARPIPRLHARHLPAASAPAPHADFPPPAPSLQVEAVPTQAAPASPVLVASEPIAVASVPTASSAATPPVAARAYSNAIAVPDDDPAIVQVAQGGSPSAPIERSKLVAAPPPVTQYTVPPKAPPPLAVDLSDPTLPAAATPSTMARKQVTELAEQPLRPVDIAQISDSDVRSLRPAQLHEPGLIAGSGPNLAQKIAAMQVTPLPPARLPSSERAKYLAEAPTEMVVRIGATALGKVDFRMTEARAIDVRLSGLLDLLADHYSDAEFARLRNSAAADAYVSLDQLRAMGLLVRYDPVYDEVRIDG